MTRRTVYLVLAVVGAVAPYWFFLQFFDAEGLGGNFLGALYANGAAGGFATDLFVTSVVFWIFLYSEGRRAGVPHLWSFVVVNLAIGLSCAFPLFLWARERARGRPAPAS